MSTENSKGQVVRLKQPSSERKDLLTIVREWATATVALMLLLGGFAMHVLNASAAHAAEAKKVATDEAEKAKQELASLRGEVTMHVADERQARLEQKSDTSEIQRDIRELYRVVREPGRRSARLEKPLADGGGQ